MGTIGAIYNFSYYPSHLERNGYCKDVDWVEFEVKVPAGIDERLERLAIAVGRKNGLRVIRDQESRGEILSYAREIFHVLNESYKGLYGVVPLTEKQIDMYINLYFKLLKPEYISIVLDRGRPGGRLRPSPFLPWPKPCGNHGEDSFLSDLSIY